MFVLCYKELLNNVHTILILKDLLSSFLSILKKYFPVLNGEIFFLEIQLQNSYSDHVVNLIQLFRETLV